MITEAELNLVKGMLHWLNQGHMTPPDSPLAAEVKLIDRNGESLGRIDFNGDTEEYCFYPAGGNND